MKWPSGDWDAWNSQGGPRYPHEKVVQFCFRNYPSSDRVGIRALDVGCGSGVHTAFLATEGFQVTAVDMSTTGIANTTARLKSLGLHAEVKHQSADSLDFPPHSFELAICIGVLDAAGPQVARGVVEKLKKQLVAGGRAMFLFASNRDFRVGIEHQHGLRIHGYTEQEVRGIFEGAFPEVWIDRYITTYEGGNVEQNDWLVTIRN